MADLVSTHVRGELRAELARREMTQRDAARKLGVNPMWVSERLSGATRITIDDLARFADLLDVPISSLLDGSPTGRLA